MLLYWCCMRVTKKGFKKAQGGCIWGQFCQRIHLFPKELSSKCWNKMQAFKKCLHKAKALELICFHPRTALKSNFSNQYILIRYTVYIRHTYNADVCVIRSKRNCRVHTLQLRLLARNKRELSGPIKCEKGHHKPLWLYGTVNMGVSLISAWQSDFGGRWPFMSCLGKKQRTSKKAVVPFFCYLNCDLFLWKSLQHKSIYNVMNQHPKMCIKCQI